MSIKELCYERMLNYNDLQLRIYLETVSIMCCYIIIIYNSHSQFEFRCHFADVLDGVDRPKPESGNFPRVPMSDRRPVRTYHREYYKKIHSRCSDSLNLHSAFCKNKKKTTNSVLKTCYSCLKLVSSSNTIGQKYLPS